MIVKMKKVSVISLLKDQNDTLERLRDAGLLHIDQAAASSDDLNLLKDKKSRIQKALSHLSPSKSTPTPVPPAAMDDILQLSQNILQMEEEKQALREQLVELAKERNTLSPWGNFDPEDVRFLKEKGLEIRLSRISPREYLSLSDTSNIYMINRTKSLIYCVFIGHRAPRLIYRNRVPLPARGLETIDTIIGEKSERIRRIEQEIERLGKDRNKMEYVLQILDEGIEFEEKKAGMLKDENITVINGFIPKKKTDVLKKIAARHQWGLLIRTPEEDDNVPTLVENPKWVRIIQPVFNMLGTVPGYREFDISSWFLVFLSLFFAMIIGDAGYGFLFLGIAVIARFKQKDKTNNEPVILLFVLSISTIIWGAITGTWFGSQTLAQSGIFSWMIIPQISSFNEQSGEFIKKLTFIIGAIHLSIAHLKGFFRYFPALKAYAQLGWLSLVLGLYFLVLNLVLDAVKYPLTSLHTGLIFFGLFLVLIFSEQEGRFLKGLLKSLATFPLKLLDSVSAFSDIISYIRLFAVGLATVEIAKSFNLMAEKMAQGTTGLILAILVLVIGHSLNLAMSALSVVVHGIRLKMLEFSGHLGIEWKGSPYKPFKRNLIIPDNINHNNNKE